MLRLDVLAPLLSTRPDFFSSALLTAMLDILIALADTSLSQRDVALCVVAVLEAMCSTSLRIRSESLSKVWISMLFIAPHVSRFQHTIVSDAPSRDFLIMSLCGCVRATPYFVCDM